MNRMFRLIAGQAAGARAYHLFIRLRRINPVLGSFIIAAIFLAFALALPVETGKWSASAILLMAVLASASAWGVREGLLVSVAAALAYDYFFIPPVYTLNIDEWRDVLALLIFIVSAAAVSLLAQLLNRRMLAARHSEILARRQYAFSNSLGGAESIEAIAEKLTSAVSIAAGAKAILLVPAEGGKSAIAAFPPGTSSIDPDFQAKALERNSRRIGDWHPAGGTACTFLPISLAPDKPAILAIGVTTRRFWQVANRTRMIDLMAAQATAAFERVLLSRQAKEAQVASEAEKLRAALLASISHDLKTPLAVIMGAASSLRDLGPSLPEAAARELLTGILDEGERLNQFIANILDMSQVQSSAIKPKRELADLREIVGSALHRAERLLSHRHVRISAPPDLAGVELDPVFMEKALFSVLENAALYTPAGSEITVSLEEAADLVILEICDEGPGLHPEEIPYLFEKFYRGKAGKRKPAGTGLGLAIAKGFLHVLGGTITARNRQDRSGAVFTIALPAAEAAVRQPPPTEATI
jgi:two-component system, OmpR family, sensor histidine kinase KdpD